MQAGLDEFSGIPNNKPDRSSLSSRPASVYSTVTKAGGHGRLISTASQTGDPSAIETDAILPPISKTGNVQPRAVRCFRKQC